MEVTSTLVLRRLQNC